MSKRLLFGVLLAALVASNSGCRAICCLHDNLLAAYQSHRWHGCGCGETYYNPWYNNPPDCWDPCDDHGYFSGRRWWKTACDPSGSGCSGFNCAGGGGGMQGGAPNMADEYQGQGNMETMPAPGGSSEEMPTPAMPPAGAPRTFGPGSAPPPSSGPPRVGRRVQRYQPADEEPNFAFEENPWASRGQNRTAGYRR